MLFEHGTEAIDPEWRGLPVIQTRKANGIRSMRVLKIQWKFSMVPLLLAAATAAPASQLSTDARGAIPHDVQQLVVIDYRAMENSPTAMDLRARDSIASSVSRNSKFKCSATRWPTVDLPVPMKPINAT